MNIWHDIEASRINKDDFVAVVEVSKGSKQKYELDKKTGGLILDRILYTSTHYPANYGFIPRTYAGDGDPMDVLILCSESLVPLSMVRCYPIGMITMVDGGKRTKRSLPFLLPIPITTVTRVLRICPGTFLRKCNISSVYTNSWKTRARL